MKKREREYVAELEAKVEAYEALLRNGLDLPEPMQVSAEGTTGPEATVGYTFNSYRIDTDAAPSGCVEFCAIRGDTIYRSFEKEHVKKFLEGKSFGARREGGKLWRSRKDVLLAMRQHVLQTLTAKLANIDKALADASDAPLIFGE